MTARRNLEPLYTANQVAERYQTSAQAVRKWVYGGKLPGSFQRNRRIYIPESALEAFERKAPRY